MPLVPTGLSNHNQFVVGPDFANREGWTRLSLSRSLRLSAHPDLPVHTVTADDLSLTLLGFMLDWAHPERSDNDILQNLSSSARDFETCWRATAELGGRWALIFQDGSGTRLFHDASGQRQICYTTGDELWCATQPGLIVEQVGLEPDPEALSFIGWHRERVPEYWWPGDRLGIAGVRALLPNHALSIEERRPFRYWPEAPLERMRSSDVCERVGARLAGILRAAANRFDIALGLSAGWDSRILLATARPIVDGLSIYNGCGVEMPETHRDVVIPRRLADRLGLRLDPIAERHDLDPEFAAHFDRHSWMPHAHLATGMQADFECYRRRKVAVIGNVSEIGKLPYRGKLVGNQPFDGRFLAHFFWDGHDFAAAALDEWLADVGDLRGFNLLDLFYWEQRLGRWLAANCVEFDFAWRDVLAPFNIRGLMVDLLACDEELRSPPHHKLYRMLIESHWPELLSEPINPSPKIPFSRRIKASARRGLKAIRTRLKPPS